jgi:L-lysine exporter family protein LysE/ArgO
MDFSAYFSGLSVLLSLIVAIGAQNAFVLRQGLRDEHVLAVVLNCALSDAALIALGVSSFSGIMLRMPWLDPVLRWGGACFLAWYGAMSLRSALRWTGALTAAGPAERAALKKITLTCLAITWLNPHVYLDTVVLIGAISTQLPGAGASFAAGAMTGSFVFFLSLGYGAKRLRPIFARPSAWRTLEAVIALVMWSVSFRLVAGA